MASPALSLLMNGVSSEVSTHLAKLVPNDDFNTVYYGNSVAAPLKVWPAKEEILTWPKKSLNWSQLAAQAPDPTGEICRLVSKDTRRSVRRLLASNPDIPEDVVIKLANWANKNVDEDTMKNLFVNTDPRVLFPLINGRLLNSLALLSSYLKDQYSTTSAHIVGSDAVSWLVKNVAFDELLTFFNQDVVNYQLPGLRQLLLKELVYTDLETNFEFVKKLVETVEDQRVRISLVTVTLVAISERVRNFTDKSKALPFDMVKHANDFADLLVADGLTQASFVTFNKPAKKFFTGRYTSSAQLVDPVDQAASVLTSLGAVMLPSSVLAILANSKVEVFRTASVDSLALQWTYEIPVSLAHSTVVLEKASDLQAASLIERSFTRRSRHGNLPVNTVLPAATIEKILAAKPSIVASFTEHAIDSLFNVFSLSTQTTVYLLQTKTANQFVLPRWLIGGYSHNVPRSEVVSLLFTGMSDEEIVTFISQETYTRLRDFSLSSVNVKYLAMLPIFTATLSQPSSVGSAIAAFWFNEIFANNLDLWNTAVSMCESYTSSLKELTDTVCLMHGVSPAPEVVDLVSGQQVLFTP